MKLKGAYDGDKYTVEGFRADPGTHPSKPTVVYQVQRAGKEPHNVLIGTPPDCDCFDFLNRDGRTPVPCRHVYAARKIIAEHQK